MYNIYIIPICDISKSRVYNLKMTAQSTKDCQDKIMDKFSEYSNSDDYREFLRDLDEQDILIGKITDIEEI